MTMKLQATTIRDEKGMVLVGAILVFMMLSLAAIYTAYQTTLETHIAANNKSSVQALYVSEAGVEESRVRLLSIGESGTPSSTWRAFIGSAQNAANLFPDKCGSYNSSNSAHHLFASQQTALQYVTRIRHKTEDDLKGTPCTSSSTIVLWGDGDGNGTLEQNTSKGNPVEIVTSVGVTGNATNRITAELVRDSLDLKYAVWGNAKVETKNSGTVWKGNTTEPYVASVGSNVHVEIKNNAQIYGDVDIGKNAAGVQGTFTDKGTIHGTGPNDKDRVDPDPLGAFSAGSELDAAFTSVSTTNDNLIPQKTDKEGKVSAGIVNNTIDLGNGDSMTLTAGNYYLASMTLGNSSTLSIDVSAGAVNIYMTGTMELQNGSTVAINPPSATPDNVTVYSKADDTASSSSSIDIKNSSNFTGVIYAPRANIDVHNSGNAYGMIWGNQVTINNTGQVVYDPSLKNKFVSSKYSLISWKEDTP